MTPRPAFTPGPLATDEDVVAVLKENGSLSRVSFAREIVMLRKERASLYEALRDLCDRACWSLSGPQHHIAGVDAAKIERARAALALALVGETRGGFAPRPQEPKGCPTPGACSCPDVPESRWFTDMS